jgi:hypothetical protein
MLDFTDKEKIFLQRLNTPARAQDFLNSIPFNFESNGETLKSPLFSLRKKSIHCFEGALLGAYVLSLHGFPPLVLHLKSTKEDYDHVIAPFKIDGLWGALSKTNHAVLRYREPVYKNIRELVMSYFHEYFLGDDLPAQAGAKTLRQYSKLFNLNTFNKNWSVSEKNLWFIDKKLDKIKHYNILPKILIKKLRKADQIEIKAGEIMEYKK